MTKHGRMIKRWRKANGLAQAAAAKRLRTSQANVCRIETGKHGAGERLAARIEKVCAA